MLAALSSRELTELAAFYALEAEVQDNAMKAAELKAAVHQPVRRRGRGMGGP